MRCREGTEIPLRLRLAAIDEPLQISRTEHGCGRLRLRDIDVLAFASARAIVQRSQNGERAVRRRDIIGKSGLTSRARPFDLRIAPKISHSGESHKDRAKAHEI